MKLKTALFRLLVKLIEDYEEEVYQLEDWSKLKSHEILQHLLEASHQEEKNLREVINVSKETMYAIMNGEKVIEPEQAQKLGIYFKVSPHLFLE